jgi:hypothetical protein
MNPEHQVDIASEEGARDFRRVTCWLACIAGVLFVVEILLLG